MQQIVAAGLRSSLGLAALSRTEMDGFRNVYEASPELEVFAAWASAL